MIFLFSKLQPHTQLNLTIYLVESWKLESFHTKGESDLLSLFCVLEVSRFVISKQNSREKIWLTIIQVPGIELAIPGIEIVKLNQIAFKIAKLGWA